MKRLFGTDGIRGIANSELSCELAMKIGKADAVVIKEGRNYKPLCIIGMDTRLSSQMLCNSIAAGLCSGGVNVLILGVIPTPAVAYLIKKYKADAGIMITASHNPAEFNGIKIFNEEGYKLPDALEEQIESMVSNDNNFKFYNGHDVGTITYSETAIEDYINFLSSTIDTNLEGLKIIVDTANGASSKTAEKLFKKLGLNPIMLSDKPNGININDKCGSTNLENLKENVKNNKCDIGIAFDGDADRFLCVDELGNEIDGDQVMAICAYNMMKENKLAKNTVIGTIMTNLGFVKFCENNGIKFIATKVGDRFVLEEMLIGEYNFGGEQSGHVIFKDYATTGDGELTAIKLLSIMKKTGKKLSELTKVMEKYPQVSENINVTNEAKLKFYNNIKIKESIEIQNKKLGENGRVIVRPSGTEPKIRVMVEGNEEDKINETLKELVKVIREELVNEIK